MWLNPRRCGTCSSSSWYHLSFVHKLSVTCGLPWGDAPCGPPYSRVPPLLGFSTHRTPSAVSKGVPTSLDKGSGIWRGNPCSSAFEPNSIVILSNILATTALTNMVRGLWQSEIAREGWRRWKRMNIDQFDHDQAILGRSGIFRVCQNCKPAKSIDSSKFKIRILYKLLKYPNINVAYFRGWEDRLRLVETGFSSVLNILNNQRPKTGPRLRSLPVLSICGPNAVRSRSGLGFSPVLGPDFQALPKLQIPQKVQHKCISF